MATNEEEQAVSIVIVGPRKPGYFGSTDGSFPLGVCLVLLHDSVLNIYIIYSIYMYLHYTL